MPQNPQSDAGASMSRLTLGYLIVLRSRSGKIVGLGIPAVEISSYYNYLVNIEIPRDAILVEGNVPLPTKPMSRLKFALLRRPYLPPVHRSGIRLPVADLLSRGTSTRRPSATENAHRRRIFSVG
ncbi:hypothetical protein TWF788_010254 [Orbilia oligospora]|uniref:Uncharacterized protein n=1 Tax=Orbilia oligospora TaxID=2813651 RepID=A0A7C8PF71_ORBOL|nr:hypothetical protein TWF788_010254 [Orbilia oligospora]